MHKSLAALALSVCFLLSLSSVMAQVVGGGGAVFALPEENGNVILLPGASYSQAGAIYGATNHSGQPTYSWVFPSFSMGNGTTNLRISAQDCNVTVTSLTSQRNLIESHLFNQTKMLNCAITGTGAAEIDFGFVTNQTTTVYIDGVQKQQGDGWSYNGFGVLITEAASKVAIYTQYTDYVPPRINPIDDSLTYAGIIIGLIVSLLVIFLMTELKGYRVKPETEKT